MKQIQKIFSIKTLLQKFLRKNKLNKTINDSVVKNEKILQLIGDDTDYDGMGNYKR